MVSLLTTYQVKLEELYVLPCFVFQESLFGRWIDNASIIGTKMVFPTILSREHPTITELQLL